MRRSQGSAIPGGRAVRVAEQLHHELASMIRAEVKDPRIGMVTLTSLDLTPDYAHATVWFAVLPDDDASVARTEEGLRASAGWMRTQLTRRLRLHTTPELHFSHDRSTERGIAMGKLIAEANARRSADEA